MKKKGSIQFGNELHFGSRIARAFLAFSSSSLMRSIIPEAIERRFEGTGTGFAPVVSIGNSGEISGE